LEEIEATFSFEILLDCVLLDFDVLHDSLEALDGIVQAGDDARWRKLCESEKQHQAERLDIVVIDQRVQNTLDECREIDPVEACAELSGQYTELRMLRWTDHCVPILSAGSPNRRDV
jgi:hypothetical protein